MEVLAVNLKMAFGTSCLLRSPLTAIVSSESISKESVCVTCHAMKDKHEWLKLQCMSLFQREYIRVHARAVVLSLGLG